MTDTLEFFLWFVGIPAGLLVILVITWGLEWIAWQLGSVADRCQDSLAGWRTNASQRSARAQDQRAFMNWLHERAGTGSLGGGVNETLVEAQRQSDMIRALVEEEVPKAVLRCVETHRLFAQVSGAYHMAEIAHEPECQQARSMAVWLLSHSVELLDNYPLRFEDSRLLHNNIVLRKRALPTCRRCPYIQLAVDQTPRLCPTAELVQLQKATPI